MFFNQENCSHMNHTYILLAHFKNTCSVAKNGSSRVRHVTSTHEALDVGLNSTYPPTQMA